ncbi:MAG: homoserine dehydrogenase, partial [Verrucomicrobiota bacterium]
MKYVAGGVERPASRTTPESAELQTLLAEMRDSGERAVAMEVSSHSLVQDRTRGVEFDAAVFTNLTQDHLDYHETMEAYFAAKSLLFGQLAEQRHKKGTAVVNVDASMMDQVNLGLVGGGTVGGGVWQALQRNGDLMAARLGLRLEVVRMAVRDPKRTRGFTVPAPVLTGDWSEVVHDPKVQVVVELMGGTTTAREVVRAALKLGKPVVTANKALLSAHGPELFALAAKHRTNLYYEAAVAGGIPIIKALRESFAGNRITRIAGIVNGTCNYILTRMKLEGAEFSEVLADAQRLGYAEAEPSLDIDGHDAAHKIGILASLAHGFWVRPETIHTEGIRHLSKLDIQFAGQLGYTIKLLGIIQLVASPTPAAAKKAKNAKKAPADGQASGIQVSVYPALVPNTHVLASVNHAFNAVAVRGDTVGDTLFYGRG